MRRFLTVLLLASAGCASEPVPVGGPAVSLELVASDSVVTEGQSVTWAAVALDADGNASSDPVTWTARDLSTASVSGAGVVHGEAPGLAWIVAESGALAESALVRVQWANIPIGDMRIRLTGFVTLEGEWHGFGQYTDLLAADTGETTHLEGQKKSLVAEDSSLTIHVPFRLTTGRVVFEAHVPGTAFRGREGLLFLDGPATGDGLVFGSLPGGTLDVTMAQYPARPGFQPGEVRAVLSLRMLRYVAGPGGLVPGTDTVTVFAEYRAHIAHRLRPNVRVTLDGGPLQGTSLFSTAQVDNDGRGGILIGWSSDFDLVPQSPRYEISQEIRLAAPGTGTFALGDITPVQWAAPGSWPAAYSALFYRDDPRLALSTGGSVTIAHYLAPTPEDYGEIAGTLTAPLSLWTDDTTESGTTATATATFHVQLWPLAGIPGLRSASQRLLLADDAVAQLIQR